MPPQSSIVGLPGFAHDAARGRRRQSEVKRPNGQSLHPADQQPGELGRPHQATALEMLTYADAITGAAREVGTPFSS